MKRRRISRTLRRWRDRFLPDRCKLAVLVAATYAQAGQPMHPNQYRAAQVACGRRPDQPLEWVHVERFLRRREAAE